MCQRHGESGPPLPAIGGALTRETEALRRQIAELTDAVAARDTFIAVAGHELRSPMTPILGQLELLLAAVRSGRFTPEQLDQRLSRVQQAVRHYLKRAAVLLDVSRLTTGKLRIELEEFDLAALLREVAESFAEEARYAGAPMAVTAPERLTITSDRLALEQVIDNLLSNALKYGGRTNIDLVVQQSDGRVHVEVTDHGPGIPEADRVRVFERFERAVGEGERRTGFGVGLWVVGQLVAALAGTIAIGDAPGGGALFQVSLPSRAKGPGD